MKNKYKLGIKITTNEFNLVSEIYNQKKYIDFIEIKLFTNFTTDNFEFLKKLKTPYVIHLPNSNQGIDFGDINFKSNNKLFINKINDNIELFNQINPLCYIIHPESGDVKLSIQNIKCLNIHPIAIENMPFKSIHGGELLGYDPISLNIYFDEINNLHFCFDINHAIKSAVSKGINYLDFLTEFLKWRVPKIYHLSGGHLDNEIDEHLSIYEGDYNINKIKKVILQSNSVKYITFETPREEYSLLNDIKNMKFFLNS